MHSLFLAISFANINVSGLELNLIIIIVGIFKSQADSTPVMQAGEQLGKNHSNQNAMVYKQLMPK